MLVEEYTLTYITDPLVVSRNRFPEFRTWKPWPGTVVAWWLMVQAPNRKPYLNPEQPTLFKDFEKETIVMNPKKVGSLGSKP